MNSILALNSTSDEEDACIVCQDAISLPTRDTEGSKYSRAENAPVTNFWQAIKSKSILKLTSVYAVPTAVS